MDNATVRDLIDAGIHFGHRVGRWHPKMKPYVFCERNSIHIIDIKETIKGLLRAKKFLASVVASGKDVLFVGTKRQARQPILDQTRRSGMPSVTERWLGGTLTNFRTIRSRLSRLEELEKMDSQGLMATESKKKEATLRREMRKITRNLDGIRNMNELPGALVIIDCRREHLAVSEARKLKIPSVCLIDTDSDPDLVDLVIPGNDDAMRAIEIIATELADAVMEGMAARVERSPVEEQEPTRPRSRRISTSRAAAQSAPDAPPAPVTPAAPAAVENSEQPAPAPPVAPAEPAAPPPTDSPSQ